MPAPTTIRSAQSNTVIPTGNDVCPDPELARCGEGLLDGDDGVDGVDGAAVVSAVDGAVAVDDPCAPDGPVWLDALGVDTPWLASSTPADPDSPEPEDGTTAIGAGVMHGCAEFEHGAGGG